MIKNSVEPSVLTIRKGKPFSFVIRWGAGPPVFKAVTGVPQLAPVRLAVTAHGLPTGWFIFVSNMIGMEKLTRPEPYSASVIDANTLELIGIDASRFGTFGGSGNIVFASPVDLTGFTAIGQIRPSVASATILLSLTTANGRVSINNVLKTITVSITAADTAALTWSRGVFELEMSSSAGIPTRVPGRLLEIIAEDEIVK